MTIRKRGSAWQVDVSFQGKRRQEQAPDEIQAKIRELEMLQELQDEAAGKASKTWTLEQAVEKVEALIWKGTPSHHSTMKNARLMLGFFGKRTLLKDIDTDWVDRWVVYLEKEGNASGTINRKLACLSKVLSFAVERGALNKKPHLGRKPEGEGRIRWLSDEEEKTLLSLFEAWEKQDHKDLVAFLLDTGCRPGEAYGLTSRDVNFESGMATFWETKNGSSRSVPMTSRVREILLRRAKDTVRPFPFNDSWLRSQWDRARFKMGLAEDAQFVPYCCRHTCASRLAQRGVHLAVIRAWMGHKTLQITMRYAHLSPTDLLSGAKALEQGRDIPMSSSG